MGHSELNSEVEIRPDGFITFPLVGDVHATSRSPEELAQLIQDGLAEYVIEPKVTVMVVQFRTIGVQVLGEVSSPGFYQVRADARVMDAIGLAGGPTRLADLTSATLTRSDWNADQAEIFNLNLQAFIANGALDQNPVLQNGDVIYLTAVGRVLILGEVHTPGGYEVVEGMDVLDLLADAGGALASADLEQVVITRTENGIETEITVNLQDMMAGRGKGLTIRPNDVVFVPAKKQVIVLGQVPNPGTYSLNKDGRLLDIIGSAGGVTLSADGRNISITRTVNGEQQVIVVDAEEALKGRQGGENPILQGGDIVYVPEGRNNVLVLGQVNNPGQYPLTEQTRILDILALAGGPTSEAALQKATLTRESDTEVEIFEIDLEKMQRHGTGQSLKLVPGDVLFIPEGTPEVLILGEVSRPGNYRVNAETRILDVIGNAGGVLDTAGSTLLLTRDGRTSEIDLGALTRLGLGNQRVQAGDVLYVQQGANQVLVLGQVKNPGYYHLNYGDRVVDAIARAGGLLDNAAASEVTVTRQVGDLPEINYLNIEELMQNRFLPNNLVLQGGDIIIVPEANKRVLVFGEVNKPGYYPTSATTRILDVLAAAGGLNQRADTIATLTREIEGEITVEKIDLATIMETGEGNIRLTGGEMLLIPEANREVLVFGAVSRPGMYTFRTGEKVLDIIARAGGVTANADLTVATLTRYGEEYEVITLDVASVFEDNNLPQNIVVQGGDILFIPEANRRVTLLGQVSRPGAYVVDENTRLLDLLAQAGGATTLANTREITVTRTLGEGVQVFEIDLEAVINNKAENIYILGGDVVFVPEARQVAVMGEVNRPGLYTLPSGARILDVLALTGGLRSNLSSQEIVLSRQGPEGTQLWSLTYGDLLNDNEMANLILTGGDVLFVPEARKQVLVLGEVARPGVYSISEGARVLDAIALAGGPTDRAALEAVGIYRDGDMDASATLAMGKDKLLFQGSASDNPLIMGGDVIFVPETTKPNWTAIFGFVSGVKSFKDLLVDLVDLIKLF